MGNTVAALLLECPRYPQSMERINSRIVVRIPDKFPGFRGVQEPCFCKGAKDIPKAWGLTVAAFLLWWSRYPYSLEEHRDHIFARAPEVSQELVGALWSHFCECG